MATENKKVTSVSVLIVAGAAFVCGLSWQTLGSAGLLNKVTNAQSGNGGDAMIAFGKSHDECQLWTNWQVLCSKTGPAGETECRTTTMKVKPSTPFCVGQLKVGNSVNPRPRSALEQVSYLRFCDEDETKKAGYLPGSCRYLKSRPFNGHRLSDQLSGWCDEWLDALTFRPVCRMGSPKAGVPNCVSLARGGYSLKSGYVCGRTKIPNWCAVPENLGYIPPQRGKDSIMNYRIREADPVIGPYCRERKYS